MAGVDHGTAQTDVLALERRARRPIEPENAMLAEERELTVLVAQ